MTRTTKSYCWWWWSLVCDVDIISYHSVWKLPEKSSLSAIFKLSIFHKIHNFRTLYLTKFTFSECHNIQNETFLVIFKHCVYHTKELSFFTEFYQSRGSMDFTTAAAAPVSPNPVVDCCQWAACYDPVYHMCVDTCPPERKCQAEQKRSFRRSPIHYSNNAFLPESNENSVRQTQWVPCPAYLTMPDCTSVASSLPLECYPDIPQMRPLLNMRRHLNRVSWLLVMDICLISAGVKHNLVEFWISIDYSIK